MEAKLQKRDLGFIGICLLVAVVSLVIGIHYFYRAFPEASIDFRLTRDEAQTQAEIFLTKRGFDLQTYRHSAIFRYDDKAKTFLERELGLQGATATIGQPVQLWRWSNRWVRELQKEEFSVEITTSGQLVGFSHLIADDAARLLPVQFPQPLDAGALVLEHALPQPPRHRQPVTHGGGKGDTGAYARL